MMQLNALLQDAHANEYSGPRECPIVITFRLSGPAPRMCDSTENENEAWQLLERADVQHVSITKKTACLETESDPLPIQEHRFPFHRRYSKTK